MELHAYSKGRSLSWELRLQMRAESLISLCKLTNMVWKKGIKNPFFVKFIFKMIKND
jgi:hypothetical protein